MIIKRRSQMSGVVRERDLNLTQEQYDQWRNGALIQNAMPQLSKDDREFIMTGITQEEWDEAYGERE